MSRHARELTRDDFLAPGLCRCGHPNCCDAAAWAALLRKP